MSESEGSHSRMSAKSIITVIGCLVIVGAVAAAVFFYTQYAHAQQLLKNPTLVAQQQTDQLVLEVGKLMELPKNEQPTVATVSDVTKLKDQPFFQNAKNGDKVLIYTKARKAILYRPSENKIVDVAPVNLGSNEEKTPTPSITKSPTITPTAKPTVPVTQ